jgi:hypothetical protein
MTGDRDAAENSVEFAVASSAAAVGAAADDCDDLCNALNSHQTILNWLSTQNKSDARNLDDSLVREFEFQFVEDREASKRAEL